MPRPSPRPYDIEQLFASHRPKEQHLPKYDAVRAAAVVFAETLLEHVPPGSDQDDAIRHVRKAVMMANSAIALEGSILKSETVMSRLDERVFFPSRSRNTIVSEIHMHKVDVLKLHGHARFAREIDEDRLRRGIAGRIEGAVIVISSSVSEGSVRVVERGGPSSTSEPIVLSVT